MPGPDPRDILTLDEFEQLARGVLPTMVYEYVVAGAADEHTLRRNRTAYDALLLRPRVLVDVGSPGIGVELFGQRLPHPILLAPAAYQRTMHPDGELAAVQGAGATGTTYIVSTATTTPVAEIAKAASAPLWFQLYVQSDRGFTQDVVQEVQEAGCQALCVTVDTASMGARDRMTRAQFALPPGLDTPHLYDVSSRRRGVITPERTTLTWADIEWLQSIATVPILLKGILDPDDAELAVAAGVQGIIVSNHGARNLDTTLATIEALPAVVDRVAGRLPVLVDGGIRRGTDLLKALALGARAVLIGRPYCFGLAVGGAAGVERVVEILLTELRMAMKLTGRPAVEGLDRGVLWTG